MPWIQVPIKTLYQVIQYLTLMFLLHYVKALVHVSLGIPFKILYHIIICHLIFVLSLVSNHQNAYPHESEALSHPRWKDAMIDEMKALEKNGTSELMELPKGKKTVGCKWVFTLKHNPDGSIQRYNARLVAKDLLKHMWLTTLRLFLQWLS